MKLDEFISTVLLDIENGFNTAKEQSGKGYSVISDKSSNNGVLFDIAVTATSGEKARVEGKAKAGIIEVLGAGVGSSFENSSQTSHVSRIQFSVRVPVLTEAEFQEQQRRALEASRNQW